MLAYRNTPDPVTKISPAIAVFARPIKELIPVLPGKLNLHSYWDKLLDASETTKFAAPSQITADTQPPPSPLVTPPPVRVHLLWNPTRHGTHFQGNLLRHRVRSLWQCSLVNQRNLPPLQTDPPYPPCSVQHGNA